MYQNIKAIANNSFRGQCDDTVQVYLFGYCGQGCDKLKIECEQCHKLGYLQTLGNYHRARHYDGINPSTGKSKFHYHQQARDWVNNN
jgi:hypothetical protein